MPAASPVVIGKGEPDTGLVRITAGVARGRVVTQVVHSDRPRFVAAALARHEPAAIPDLAWRLFALCGVSQSVAARNALRMAGAAIATAPPEDTICQLAAERIIMHLQTTYIDWIAAVPASPPEALAILQALAACAKVTTESPGAASAGLLEALATLGILGPLQGDSWAGRLIAAAGADTNDHPPPDPLGEADDACVLAALDAEGEMFAMAPYLPGRRPETGPAARAAQRGLRVVSAADRLNVRLAEIADAAELLAEKAQSDAAGWIAMGSLGPDTGFCAVETPRGRLHHLVRLGPDRSVQRYLILAPTEWNFAADGPFAAALRGLRIADATARSSIDRLVSLYDPCVSCAVAVHQITASG